MNKKQLKKQENISMEKFLKNYVGIQNEAILNDLMSLTHREIKEVCDAIYLLDLTRISFENVTKEDIERGNILLVVDKDKNLAPYENPKLDEFEIIMDEENEKHYREIYNLENQMQTFEDYSDDLDEIVSDINTTSQQIKTLSKKKYVKKTF